MSRSRSGCATCKRRHRKCDETKPSCLQCQAQNIACEGYDLVLRWDAGIPSRRSAGTVIPVGPLPDRSKKRRRLDEGEAQLQEPGTSSVRQRQLLDVTTRSNSQSLSPGHGPSTGLTRGVEHLDASPITPSPQSFSTVDSPQTPTWHLPWPGRTERERFLFKQFCEITMFFLYSTDRNDWFKSHLCHLAYESEALLSILIATHLYTVNPKSPTSEFEEYYNRSLRLFRGQLDSYDGTPNMGIMCAGLFICTLNLFQGTPWSAHLDLMTRVYGLTSDLLHLRDLPQDLQFPIETMGVMDMPTFVRGRRTVTLGIWSRYRTSQDGSPDGRISGVEIVTGLPRSLLDIFADIQTDKADELFLMWPGDVGDVPHCHLWEAYRLAGVLTGRRLRKYMVNDDGSNPTDTGLASPSTEVLMSRLMAAMDALCETCRRPQYSGSLATNSILYPYTAARLEVAVLGRRPDWVEELRRLVKLCDPYAMSANFCTLDEMLDEALDKCDDDYDIDEQARRRNTEVAIF
ncbi:hypothetical protein N0V84_002301 [Fusarium piperis]|uniref:Zn(2)-C6 fungal-type domain-containing protein n=1 Tax=Fusarium piperis TaxID=1435070 RepID=A0A9W9BSH1_9HYPO|nr:hypothetical protein N0V84_002301 [Fusarium piperis]